MKASTEPRDHALAQYRHRAPVYDAELALFEPIRRAAVGRLGLRPGDRVLDIGCGTGLSLPLLRAAVGAHGTVVGVEQCPEMLDHARRCVARAGWRNVTLVESSAEHAVLEPGADAAMFHFTHDILRAPAALANATGSLRPAAHVVASGLQWSAPWLWPVNFFVLGAALHSVTSLAGLSNPWSLLATQLEGLQIDQHMAGAVFIASGQLRH